MPPVDAKYVLITKLSNLNSLINEKKVRKKKIPILLFRLYIEILGIFSNVKVTLAKP